MRALWLVGLLGLGTIAGAPPAERQSGKLIGSGNAAAKIELTSPKGGWTVDRMVLVQGTVSDPSINPVTVSINGDRYLLKTVNGSFKRKFPVTAGKNAITVQGANKAGTAKAERTLHAQVPPLGIFLILTSDTDGVYTDLHVYEPPLGSSDPFLEGEKSSVHVYWADTSSKSGGKFYLNEQEGGEFDSPGFGPYVYSHASPSAGIYRVDANYWPSGDKAHTVGTLNIVLFGGTVNETRRSVQYPLVMPGETVTLAWIRIDRDQKGFVYVPSLDEKPKTAELWPKWVLHMAPRRKGAGAFEGEGGESL